MLNGALSSIAANNHLRVSVAHNIIIC